MEHVDAGLAATLRIAGYRLAVTHMCQQRICLLLVLINALAFAPTHSRKIQGGRKVNFAVRCRHFIQRYAINFRGSAHDRSIAVRDVVLSASADERSRELATIDRLAKGDASAMPLLTDLCNTMKSGSLCALGGFTPYPVMSALTHFPDDFSTQKEAAE